MKYYSIGSSDNLKVIGHYPQTEFKKDFNHGTPNSYRNVHPREFPNFNPDLEITLHKNAIPTDYIEKVGPAFGIIINKIFKTVLEQFNLPPHRFYPIKVYHKAELLEYYWFHYIIDIWEFVDIEKSSAQIFHKFKFEVQEIIPIPNLDSILDFKKSLDRKLKLKINSLILKKNHPKYDAIETTKVEYSGVLLSENLVNTLNEAGLTGFETKPFDKIVCE